MRLLAVSSVLARLRRGWTGPWRWLVCGVLFHATLARAEEPPLVMLELERCDELEETEIRRIVAAELGARPAHVAGEDVTQITVKCAGTRVVVHVTDPLSRKAVQRSFDIGLSDPRARGRLVAIAATELVLASWMELETNRPLQVEPEGPAPPPAITKAAREIALELLAEHYEPKSRAWYDLETPPNRMLRLVPLASARAFLNHPGTLYGGGLRIGEERFRFLSWAADILLEEGTVEGREAGYRLTTGTVGGMVFAYVQSANFTGRLGAGLRAGFAGASTTGPHLAQSTTFAPWGWPLGTLSVTLRLTRAVGIDLSGEGGYVVLPVTTDGRALSGVWFSGQVGIAITPGAPPISGAREEGAEESEGPRAAVRTSRDFGSKREL